MIKETLYQVLGVSAAASADEIQAGYQHALAVLEASENKMSREDYDFRHKLILFAKDTLSDPLSRMGYDEKLMARRMPGTPLVKPKGVTSMPIPASEDLAHRADALAMRAEAMALRADAMALRSGMEEPLGGYRSPSFSLPSSRSSPLRSLLIGMTIVAILAIMLQLYLAHSARTVRAHIESLTIAAAKAEEKLVIQEYYQKYGERVASADEARKLGRERQQREVEARAAERERQRAERDAQRQQEENRRYADRISFDLRRSEEATRIESEREEQLKQREEQRKQREEQMRVERLQQRWRSAIKN